MANKRKPTKKRDPNQITATGTPSEDLAVALEETVLHPAVQGAFTVEKYNKAYGELDLLRLANSLIKQTNSSNEGDLKRGVAMLTAQAHTLDTIFNNLAQRAALNMGEHMQACETYLKLALRAQSQCRATWEALSTIKNPPIAGFVNQANIANGPQQVNNGTKPVSEPPRTRENPNPKSKLLEEKDGERLDTGATGAAGGVDSEMAAVGRIDGTKVKRG